MPRGPAEQVKNGVSGLIVPPEPGALAAAIGRMLDTAERGRLATSARARGAALADRDAWAAALRAGLAHLLGGARAPPARQAPPPLLPRRRDR